MSGDYGPGIPVRAVLEPGECVVDKARSRALAPLFRDLGAPGAAEDPEPGEQ